MLFMAELQFNPFAPNIGKIINLKNKKIYIVKWEHIFYDRENFHFLIAQYSYIIGQYILSINPKYNAIFIWDLRL